MSAEFVSPSHDYNALLAAPFQADPVQLTPPWEQDFERFSHIDRTSRDYKQHRAENLARLGEAFLHLYDTTQEDSVEVEVLADHNAERAAVGVVVVSGLDVRNAVTDYQAANRITQGESLANMISATTRSELDEQTRRESSRTISVKLNHQPYAVAHTRFNNTLTVVRLKAEDCLPFENGVKIQERVDALTRAAYGHILWQASAGGDTSPPRSNQSQP